MLGGVVVITAAHGSGFGFRFGVQVQLQRLPADCGGV